MATNNSSNNGNLYSAGDGKILIARATGQAIAATITAGAGITVTNSTNSITIAATNEGLIVDQTSSSATLAPGTTYVCDNGASLITFTLPGTAALGDYYIINGASSGGFTIAEASGQTIHFGALAATTTSGTVASTNQYDQIKLRCVTANTTFVVEYAVGNFTIT